MNQHVETIHGGVHYPCRQWDYEATTNTNLKGHVDANNEIVCYSCSQCYYKATRNDSLKKYVELIHEGGFTHVVYVHIKQQIKDMSCLVYS